MAYPLRLSHYLELVNPLWTARSAQARVERVWDDTADTRTLTLRPGRGWRRHRAGQYVPVGVSIAGQRHTRTYSISSAPGRDDGCITITVKAVAGGCVSQALVRSLRPGDFVALGQAQGEFVLPEAIPVHPLFITSGSGITPVMAMLRDWVLEHPVLPDVAHLHYAPHAYDVIFGQELRALDAAQPHYRLHEFHTRALGSAQNTDAHFSAAQLEAVCPDWRSREVWACGPAALLDAVEAHWAAAGLSRQLHVERFQARSQPHPPAGTAGQVSFADSRVEVPSDGCTTLLQLAEGAGLQPPHGCRMGICHGCTATLLDGCVRDQRNGALHAQAGDKIQVCVCAAVGNVTLAL